MEREKNPKGKEKVKKFKKTSKSFNKGKIVKPKENNIQPVQTEKINKEKKVKNNSRPKSVDTSKKIHKEKSKKLSSSKDKRKSYKKPIKKGKSKEKGKEKKIEEGKEKEKKEEKEEKEEEEINLEDISFQKRDLYSLLGLKSSATNLDIRKAYKRLVLLCHPDKNKTDPNTSAKFVNIIRAYKILSNEQSRKLYDQTGEYDEENTGEININDTLFFFRKIYSPQDIDTYENNYIGSKEEEDDLINFYKENNGNITNILECIPCSKNEDISRFIEIYNKLFEKKILRRNKKFEETKNKIKKLKEDQEEKKEAKETLDKLTKQIMQRNKKRNYNDYLDGLANKYRDEDNDEYENNDISEEEFQKIAKRLKKHKKNKK